MKVDYLIVGQGLAGTLLAHFLQKNEQSIHIIDNSHQGAASKVAAGVINPVTGRRFVKSWRIDELIPFAEETYRSIEKQHGTPFYHSIPIVRSLFNSGEETNWILRSDQENYKHYILEDADLGTYEGRIQPSYSYGEVARSGQVDVPRLVEVHREDYLKKGILSSEIFDYAALEIEENGVRYKDIEATKIIFCEGQRGGENPYFNYLPFNDCKGEVLIVKIPNAHFKRIFKHRIFIVPLRDEHYWVGSTTDWEFENANPTEAGGSFLKNRLNDILKVPFEIIEHKAALRPTVRDRRPFLGLHPEFPQLGIFNGLGTKGASLAPLFAHEMSEHLLHQKSLHKEVDIARCRRK